MAELIGDDGFLLGSILAAPEGMFEVEGRERRDYVNLLAKLQEARAVFDALEAHTVVALAEATRRDQREAARDEAGHEQGAEQSLDRVNARADGITRRDLSLMTMRSPSAAGHTVASARRLVTSMPHLLAAMGTGKATAAAVYAAAGAASVLDQHQCEEVDAMLHARLPDLSAAGTRKWKQAVAAAIGELDPEGSVLRHRRARRGRHVTFTPGEHGMATISVQMPAIEARLVRKRLSLEAERRLVEGAKGGHGALMVDALTDTVLGREDAMGQVALDVGVIITDRALFHPGSGDVAQIEGYGPVPAEAVREQLRAVTVDPIAPEQDTFGTDGPAVRAVIRRLYTHPTSGELVSMDSRARAFPPALGRFLSWRDSSCRGPFCNASSRHHDHITPHSRGGPTSADNGQDVCAHCNQKEDDALCVERVEDPERPGHRVAWTGYGGTTRVSAPLPLREPANTSDEDCADDPPPGGEGEGSSTLPDDSAPPPTGP